MEDSSTSFVKKFGVAGMQETQGERILRALLRVYDRIQTLEEERRTAKNDVDNFDGKMKPHTAGDFHRTLAMAEARCDLLEEQLRSLREFLHGSMFPMGVPHQSQNDAPTTNHKNVVDSTSRKKSSSNSSANNHVISGDQNNLRGSSLASSTSLEQHHASSHRHRRRKPSHRSQKNESVSSSSRATTLSHYHIKMADMPFVSATSTSNSHSLRANIQNLHSLVNSHNPNIRPNLRRGRSSSVDRQRWSRSQRNRGHQAMPRWRSLSDVSLASRHRTSTESSGQRRSRGGFLTPVDIMADLDTIPVRLENNSHQPIVQDDACDHPGKVCIKTELRSQPKGCSKTFEVKMTTSTGGPTRYRGRADLQNLQNKRHMLRDLKNLQHALREDQ